MPFREDKVILGDRYPFIRDKWERQGEIGGCGCKACRVLQREKGIKIDMLIYWPKERKMIMEKRQSSKCFKVYRVFV